MNTGGAVGGGGRFGWSGGGGGGLSGGGGGGGGATSNVFSFSVTFLAMLDAKPVTKAQPNNATISEQIMTATMRLPVVSRSAYAIQKPNSLVPTLVSPTVNGPATNPSASAGSGRTRVSIATFEPTQTLCRAQQTNNRTAADLFLFRDDHFA
ncbi:MAG: hypothetical protein JSR79_03095 [Proteobacteria bacterium]|nr:hypothetical protein [Pseudomonadota bacterium]